MKALRRLLAIVAVVLGLAALTLWLKPPELLRIGANYAAKTVCSNVFLAGREAHEVLQSDVQAPGIWLLRLMRVSVDKPHGIVRVGFLGFIGRGLAVSRGADGCAVVADGRLEQVAALPPHASPAAPPSDASPWPDGNAVTPSAAMQAVLADDALSGPGMRAVLVVDHGQLIAERYGPGFGPQTPLLGWSMAKTVTAALVGLLVKDGKLKLDQSGFWPSGDGREKIRLVDLMSMSSGLAFDEGYSAVSDITRMLYLQPDMAGFAYDKPLQVPPGTEWHYSSGSANIVARIVQDSGGESVRVQDRLFGPLGMHSAVIEADERGTLVGSSYMYATGRDWARFALWLLASGVWHGMEMLPPGFVDTMTQPVAASHGQYGQGFVWLWASDPLIAGQNPDSAFGIPPDAFYLSGHDGQSIAVIRSRQLAIVRLGLTPHAYGYSPQRLIQAVLDAKR